VTLALATAIDSLAQDADMALLREACAAAGVATDVVAWDDPTVSWRRFDAVLLRSTWDYTTRLPDFLAWCERVAAHVPLWNPVEVVRWNTDKRYLGELAGHGLPVIESHYLAPGDDASSLPVFDDFVVKPTVGAGSSGARRFRTDQRAAAVDHARTLLAAGRHVLVQPYQAAIDREGETSLLFFEGRFSHAIRKAPLLRAGGEGLRADIGGDLIQPREPSEAERRTAGEVLAALPFGPLAYARVDLLPSPEGPRLLELELTEPALFLARDEGAAARFAAVLAARLDALQRDR